MRSIISRYLLVYSVSFFRFSLSSSKKNTKMMPYKNKEKKAKMICHPEIKWAQRKDKVYLTVELAGTKGVEVDLAPRGVFSFSATTGEHEYDLKLELAHKVKVNEINIGGRSIFCILKKAEPKWWNKLLTGDAKTPPYVKVDWDKWVDEDDEAGPANPIFDAFLKFCEQRFGKGQEVETKTGEEAPEEEGATSSCTNRFRMHMVL